MALDTKTIKEELPDKDATTTAMFEINANRRLKGGGGDTKDRCRTPESPEAHSPPSPVAMATGGGGCGSTADDRMSGNGSTSPNTMSPPPQSVTTALNSAAALLSGQQHESARVLMKVRRFLGALVQFGQDTSAEMGDRVRALVLSLASGNVSSEEFKLAVQDATNFPLRPYVLPFLKSHIPLLQRELTVLARASNQSISQFIRSNENSVFEFAHNSTEHTDIFLNVDAGADGGGPGSTGTSYNGGSSALTAAASLNGANGLLLKRRASDNFFDHSHVNSHHEWSADHLLPPSSKRPHHSILFNNHLQSLAYGTSATAPHPASFFDYHHLGSGNFASNHSTEQLFFGEKAAGINYREDRDHRGSGGVPSSAGDIFSHRGSGRNGTSGTHLNGGSSAHQSHNGNSANGGGGSGSNNGGGDEEWKNIHTMLNCISAMVEKTKRAITILQQRGMDTQQSYQESSLLEMKRLTDEKVAEFKRNAEEAVNQVKRQAVVEIQRAVVVAENRAVDIVAQERIKMEKLFSEINAKTSSSSHLDTHPADHENNSNVCWKCGRKATETCSGCSLAKYCSAYCQHKDWEHHIKICGSIRLTESGHKLSTGKRSAVAVAQSSRSSPPQTTTQQNSSTTTTTTAPVLVVAPSNRSTGTGNAAPGVPPPAAVK